MYWPEQQLPDVPQAILIATLETDFGVRITVGPAGDCHFDRLGTTVIEWGWDFGQAWVPAMAIHYLCKRLGVEVVDLYAAIQRHVPAG